MLWTTLAILCFVVQADQSSGEITCRCIQHFVNKEDIWIPDGEDTCGHPYGNIIANGYPFGRKQSCEVQNRRTRCDVETNTCTTTGYCFREVQYISGETHLHSDEPDCLTPDCLVQIETFGCMPNQCFNLTTPGAWRQMQCCNTLDCNSAESLGKPLNIQIIMQKESDRPFIRSDKQQKIFILVLILIILTVVCCTIYHKRLRVMAQEAMQKVAGRPRSGNGQRSQETNGNNVRNNHCEHLLPQNRAASGTNSTGECDEGITVEDDLADLSLTEPFLSSGSGGCAVPQLAKATVGLQVKTLSELGAGRFASVFLGMYMGENVAIKKFKSWDDDSFTHEVQIYETELINHPNIMRYRAADTIDKGMFTERMLIMDYYERGSLCQFLSAETVTVAEALKLIQNCAAGLEHLHAGYASGNSRSLKQSIAHRDIKSRNILVSIDCTAVIADLGLAVKRDEFIARAPRLKHPSVKKVGTNRYMSPEILAETFVMEEFDSYKHSDIYSMALVMWEVLSRTKHNSSYIPSCASLPYSQYTGNIPTVDEMHEIVVQKQLRPEFRPPSVGHPLLLQVSKRVAECWNHSPKSRLSAVRLRKNIDDIRKLSH